MKRILATAAVVALGIVLFGCRIGVHLDTPSDDSSTGNGDTITAASTSQVDVQAAVFQAEHGQTVIVPPGSSTWQNPVLVNRGITLRGSGWGKTTITNPRTNFFEGLVVVVADVDNPFRITGFTFRGADGSSSDDSDHIMVLGRTDGFRIDHNSFENGGSHSIWTRGGAHGVIDHNRFINSSREVVSLNGFGTGDESWNDPLTLGSENAVYVEDNVFRFETKGDHAITSINGARYVFRYNKIYSSAELNASQVDVHGNFFADRGARSFEIYENYLQSESSFQGMYIRGGTGVIFNNHFVGTYDYPIIFANYRSFDVPDGESAGEECDYSACSHPAPDQIRDTYVWNNTYGGSTAVPFVRDRGLERDHIQQGRDYFLQQRPGYTPYTYPHPLVK